MITKIIYFSEGCTAQYEIKQKSLLLKTSFQH